MIKNQTPVGMPLRSPINIQVKHTQNSLAQTLNGDNYLRNDGSPLRQRSNSIKSVGCLKQNTANSNSVLCRMTSFEATLTKVQGDMANQQIKNKKNQKQIDLLREGITQLSEAMLDEFQRVRIEMSIQQQNQIRQESDRQTVAPDQISKIQVLNSSNFQDLKLNIEKIQDEIQNIQRDLTKKIYKTAVDDIIMEIDKQKQKVRQLEASISETQTKNMKAATNFNVELERLRMQETIKPKTCSDTPLLLQKVENLNKLFNELSERHQRSQEAIRQLEIGGSFQLIQNLENQINAQSQMFQELNFRLDQVENCAYEFRKESFNGINEIEKVFMKKQDQLRKGLLEVCKTLNVNSPLIFQ